MTRARPDPFRSNLPTGSWRFVGPRQWQERVLGVVKVATLVVFVAATVALLVHQSSGHHNPSVAGRAPGAAVTGGGVGQAKAGQAPGAKGVQGKGGTAGGPGTAGSVGGPGAAGSGATAAPGAGAIPDTGVTPGAGSGGGAGGGKIHVDPHPQPFTACLAAPHTCGFPDATNTGVPPGTQLTAASPMTVTTAGTVINGADIIGSIWVRANNVTIENSRVICGNGCSDRFTIRVDSGLSGVTVRNVEAAGNPNVGSVIGGGGPLTVLASNIYGGQDGIHVLTGATVRDSYVHDMTPTATSHDDAIQQLGASGDNITIVHNTLNVYNTAGHIFNNSAYIGGVQSNLVFTDNLLDGGSHTLQCPRTSNNNVFARNRFGTNYRYGPIISQCTSTSGNLWDASSNVFDGTNHPV